MTRKVPSRLGQKPTNHKGVSRSQQSDSKPKPQTAGGLKDQERPLRSATLGLDLAQTPQDQELMSTSHNVVGFSREEGVDHDDPLSSRFWEVTLLRLMLHLLAILRCMRDLLMLTFDNDFFVFMHG